jgi:SAM-dependent methyltransferase
MAHPPWEGLGFYRNFDLTDEWRMFREEFTAAADDDNGRLHFDLGGSEVAVELADVSLLSADGTPACGVVQFGALRRVTPISRVWGCDRGQPVDRYYIENFLARRAGDIRGRVLEIQENDYTRRFGANRVTKSDVLDVVEGNPQATFVADLTNAPQIPSDTFDCIVFTQTLQHIYDVKATVSTLHRILKPGGVLLATVPGISQTNDARDDWYWLFTPLSAKRLVEEAFEPANIAIESFGNVLPATAFLYGLSAGELTRDELDYSEKGYEVTICIRASKSEKAG